MLGAIKIQIFKGIGRLTQGDQRERINSTTPNGQYFIKRFWNTKKLEDYNFRVKNRYSNKKTPAYFTPASLSGCKDSSQFMLPFSSTY